MHSAKRGNFAVRDLRVFGKTGVNARPHAVKNAKAFRDKKDPRNMKFVWENKNSGAKGYIINYGVAPNALHLNVQYQKPDADSLTLSCFNSQAKDYWFRIDAYNENGVTKGEIAKAE